MRPCLFKRCSENLRCKAVRYIFSIYFKGHKTSCWSIRINGIVMFVQVLINYGDNGFLSDLVKISIKVNTNGQRISCIIGIFLSCSILHSTYNNPGNQSKQQYAEYFHYSLITATILLNGAKRQQNLLFSTTTIVCAKIADCDRS